MTFSCYKKRPATTVLPPGLKPVLMLTNPSAGLKMKEPEERVPFSRKRSSQSSGAKTIGEIYSVSSKINVMSIATTSTKKRLNSEDIRPKETSPSSPVIETSEPQIEKPTKNFRNVSIADEKALNTFSSEIAVAEPTLYVECLHYNFDWNGTEHNTHFYHFYSKENLVIRRGQLFKISIKLNQPIQEDDNLSILFQLDCPIAEFSNGTSCLAKIASLIDKPQPSYNWLAFHNGIPNDSNEQLDIDIIPPLNCKVGKWKLSIYNKGAIIYTSDVSLCVIFNPLIEYGDEMPLEKPHLHEYLFKEVGDFVLGTPDKPRLEFWKFSQFHKDVLNMVYSLLYEKAQLDYIDGGDIVLVSQALIKSIMQPTIYEYQWGQIANLHALHGSKTLIEEYTKSKIIDTKKYFLAEIGILITLFRALGIPARAATGFGIVRHIKNDKSFAYNRYYTKDHFTVNDLNQELWYFRPWVEIFIPRKDIGENFCDWQYASETGPVSRSAIRKKHLEKPYGTFDAYNTMNNGILLWDYNEITNTKFSKLINFDQKMLKRKVFTKGANSRTVSDITESYELDKESTPQIYTVLKTRNRVGDYAANSKCDDLEIDFQFEEEVLIGSDIKFVLILKNKSDIHNINASYVLIFESIFPDGKMHNIIYKSEDKCIVKRNMMESREIVFKEEHYVEKMEAEYGLCRVCLQVRVKAVNYTYVVDKYISIKPPLLVMTLFMKDITEEEINFVQIQLTNSINKDIIDSKLILQEVDTSNRVVLKIKKIAALGKLIANIQLDNIDKDGEFYFVAKFISDSFKCKVFGKMEQKKDEHQYEPMNK